MTNFNDYGLSEEICKSIELLGYKKPTAVQEQVIAQILMEKDLLVQSQTGSGKTAAFAIPLCEKIEWLTRAPQVLVLEPTRELALQVHEDFFHIGRLKRIKVLPIYGRSPFDVQAKALKQKTHVVVGTPGRVMDHIERGTICLSDIRWLVIDEADEMFHLGLKEQVETILHALPQKRNTLLFSATLGDAVKDLAVSYMNRPEEILIESENGITSRITGSGYLINGKNKLNRLKDILITVNPDCCLVFCNTQAETAHLFQELTYSGFTCNQIHGGMEQKERIHVMNAFKRGEFRYLIATDVAARGIDILDVTHVVNYDLPRERENYIHRIGRTGRAEKNGQVINLIESNEKERMEELLAFSGFPMQYIDLPDPETVKQSIKAFQEKQEARILPKEEKGSNVHDGILKLRINAGKKQKIRPVDVVGTICSIEEITADDIGIIEIKDGYTLVEIMNHKGISVLKALRKKQIKGKLRKVYQNVIKAD